MIYEIIDLRGNMITKKEETIGVETSMGKKAIIKIPDNIDIDYDLSKQAFLIYADLSERAK